MDLLYLAGIILSFGLTIGLAYWLFQAGRRQMTWLLILSVVVAVALVCHLIAALLNPEGFS